MKSPFSRRRQVAPTRSLSLASALLVLLGAVIAVIGIVFAAQDFFGGGLPVPR
ncbi:hypothetical protein [Methylobacterium nodulans]|uniref:hypothetical protein n=1 Tax=Methylobacterium nodulans TaxID=114616 RepID=UPI0012EDE417|nr:hypothetical protein [Methylobacterium nodulans]